MLRQKRAKLFLSESVNVYRLAVHASVGNAEYQPAPNFEYSSDFPQRRRRIADVFHCLGAHHGIESACLKRHYRQGCSLCLDSFVTDFGNGDC